MDRGTRSPFEEGFPELLAARAGRGSARPLRLLVLGGRQQRALEGEAAPDQERDQVIAPVAANVARLGHALAMFPDLVGRQVRAQVGAGRRGAASTTRSLSPFATRAAN